ncbi:MAG: GPW/gp25 family protein [Ferribacterium limneticum]
MTGMSRDTGQALDEAAHISQSIRDILTTPVGSRLMRRTYGSLLPELIDQPANPANRLRLMAASVMAIIQWEPRVTISNVSLQLAMDGTATIDLTATRRGGQRSGNRLNISVPIQ